MPWLLKLSLPPIQMPLEDPLNTCLLAVRTLEVELKNLVIQLTKLDRDNIDARNEIVQMRRDLAIARNELDGIDRIKNYLLGACVAQLVALFIAIPTLIIQVQYLNGQSPTHKIAK